MTDASGDEGRPIRLLFVCLGNICRSPTAEAMMRHLVKQAGLDGDIEIDSAGTGDWHIGEPPDARSREVGARRGVPLGGHARQVTRGDFLAFDYLLAMDAANRTTLRRMAPPQGKDRVYLLRDFEPGAGDNAEVPDPYFGGPDGFEHVFDICERACTGLLDHLREQLKTRGRTGA